MGTTGQTKTLLPITAALAIITESYMFSGLMGPFYAAVALFVHTGALKGLKVPNTWKVSQRC